MFLRVKKRGEGWNFLDFTTRVKVNNESKGKLSPQGGRKGARHIIA